MSQIFQQLYILNILSDVLLDLFPIPIEGKWNWFHDGKTKTLVVTFHEDKTVWSTRLKDHGIWDYNRNTRILSWNPKYGNYGIHKLYFSCEQNKVVLYQPRRTPASTIQKVDYKGGE